MQTIIVDDTMVPTITCPVGVTVQCDESTDPMNTGSATATDNCDGSPAIDHSDVSTQASTASCPFYTYTITRTWLATDACGNSTTCVQIIEVEDTEAPTITCPANTTINCEDRFTAIPSMTGTPTASDNCDPAPPVILMTQIGVADIDCPQMITYTLTWVTADYCGNSATCEQIVVAQDTTRPVIFCPVDVVVECDESTEPTETGSAAAQDNCDADPVVDSFDGTVPGNCPANYKINRTWRATDACGNEATCLQTITVQDTTEPELLDCPPSDITLECGADESPMNTGVPTASDNCDPGVSYDHDDQVVNLTGQCPLMRRITRTWTITDDCGNSLTSVCLQTILVFDFTAPQITCPADITVACDVATHPDSLMLHATATDACDPMPTVVWDDAETTAPCLNDTLSAITRTWFAFDVCGNVAVCHQVIALIDNVAPAITCPADTVINCEVNPIPANTGTPTVSDNCDAAPVVSVLNDNTVQHPLCPQAKTISRTFLVTDHCGNTSTCVQTIMVQDTTHPVIVCPANITIECDDSTDPSNTGTATATDNCDAAPVITHTNLPAVPLGGCPANREFKRVWLAGDACDNGALCVQTITILDTVGPVITCLPNTILLECGSDTSATALGFATAMDNCGSATTPTRSDVVTPGNCPQEYTITRTWTSVDNCGNVGTCVQTISVDDSMAPTFTEPADITVYASANCGYDASTTVAGDVTNENDNCGANLNAVFSDATADGPCLGSKIITRTWSLNDGCGNLTTHDQIITVLDTLPPTFPKPADVTLTTDAGATCPANADISLAVSQSVPVAVGNAAFTFTVHGVLQNGPTVYSDNCSFGDSLKLFVWNIQTDFDGNADSCYRLIRVLWRVYDDCGNLVEQEQQFVIFENKAPDITFCPPSLTVNCNESTAPTATGLATATDNCDPMPVVTHSGISTDGTCLHEYTIVRIWTATDNCGNSTQCSQTITVVDDSAPTLVCPPNATVSCDDPSPTAAGSPMVSDNCDTAPTVNFNDQSTQTNLGLCSDQTYSIIRTWTAFDACGNQAIPCSQSIFVQDIVAPVITCPTDKTVNCEESLNPAVNTSLGTATSDDNCDPDPGVTFTDFATAGNCPNERTILRTWLTVDNCNNPAACTQTIYVVDDTPPAITCPKDTVINCEIDPVVTITGVATATDLCDGNPTVTHSDVSTTGACPVIKVISRTWMAVDACGNSAICVQTITMQDTTRPVIVCPVDVTVQCNESTDPSNTGEPTLSDNCDQMLASNKIDNLLPPNGCTQILLRNWITADDCNNAAACSQVITITDSEPPTLAGVPDITLQCGDVVPPVGSPTVSDNCDANPTMNYIGQDSIPGQCPNSYTILRSWALGDACGNSTVFVQTITVQDTLAPTWTDVPADVTVECDAIPDVADPTATDVCDASVTVTYDGQERVGGECPDYYALIRTWTAVDNCNNSTQHVQTIVVQDMSVPTWESALPGDITVECNQVPSPAVLEAEDNCDTDVEVTFGETRVDGTCPIRYVLTRTWMASDNCSNNIVHTQTITVTDTTPPTAVCQNITVELGQNGSATIADDAVNNGSSDVCGPVTVSTSQTTFTCANLGANTVTLTVTDGCGLSAICTATVLVRDLIPPVWATQPGTLDRTVECGDAAGLAEAQSLAPTATDNCGPVTPVKSAGTFIPTTSCPPVGTFTNTWTVMDGSGNSTSAFVQTITIADTTKPVLTCPANLTLECDDEEKMVKIADWLGSVSATDNCGGTLMHDNNYDGDSIPPVACDLSQGLTVLFTVSDNCGNTAVCSASIHVLDTQAPTFNGDCALLAQYGNNSDAATYVVVTSGGSVCPSAATVNLNVGQMISDTFQIKVGGIPVPGILGCLTDNCTSSADLKARVVAIVTSGDNCIKAFDIRMVIVDGCNNQSADTLSYLVEVADDSAPTFTAPANITVYLDENCDADLSGTGDVTNEQDNCQTGLNATYTDEQIQGQGASEYIIERTWTLTDGCGNTASAQVQFITVLDTIKPDFGCPSSIEIAPNSAGCTYVVDGADLDPDDPTDNCDSIRITYVLDGDTEISGTGSLDGVAFNEGTTTVTWTVFDGNGNSATCSFTVIVTECIQISGTLIWEGDDSDMTGVAQAMADLSGDGTDTDGPTLADGKYELISGGGGNFVVTPTKTSPPALPLNGVSVLDALLVQQYIVGLHTFPDGYKMIAADVNMSNAITTLDASIIRQAILGSSGAMAYFLNKPWRFVPTKLNTPYSTGYDPGSNPFANPIPSTRVLTAVAADAVGEDFYGIKTGDVNATGNPANKPENLDPLRLRVLDRVLEAGQNIFVPVRMAAFDNLAGYQLALGFDTDVLELLSVEPISSQLGLTPAGHFGLYKAAEGEIRSAWIDPYGQTIAAEMPVFALRFAVKQSGTKLSEVLNLNANVLSAEAYNMDHQVADIKLEFYNEQTTAVSDPTEAPGMKLLQNRPNPFTERTVIGFSLERGCDAQLRILDASGRELYRTNKAYPAGYHEETVLLRDLYATGVLYYELRTPYGVLAKKMTAITP
ncbi:MAG: HYR domain-containing protein [Saprospiraceae bacterium]